MGRFMTTCDAVEFESEGLTLRGKLYRPEGTGPFPAVVLTHGYAFVVDFFLQHNYPEHFAGQGFLALVYDHPHTGHSDGFPRQELDPISQQRAYSDAITFLTLRDDVDPERIGIWGTSYSGGHVLAVASVDPRVRAVVAQTPTIDGRRNLEHRLSAEQLAEQKRAWAVDRIDRARGLPPLSIPAGSSAASRYVLSLPFDARISYQPFVTQRSQEWYFGYTPGISMRHVAPVPLLVIVVQDDQVTPAADTKHEFQYAHEPKKLLELPGDHFDVYRHLYRKCADEATAWFIAHL